MGISSKWMSGFCEEFLKYGRQSFIEIRAPSVLAANGPNLAALVPRQKKEIEKVINKKYSTNYNCKRKSFLERFSGFLT